MALTFTPANGTAIPFSGSTTITVKTNQAVDKAGALGPSNARLVAWLQDASNNNLSDASVDGASRYTQSVSITINPSTTFNGYTGTPHHIALAGNIYTNGSTEWLVASDDYGDDWGGNTYRVRYPLMLYTSCGAPTSVSLSSTTSTGDNVTLSWSGANEGTSNSITGYDIYRREYNATAGTWGSYESYTSVSSTTTSGSLSVPVPETLNNQYQYQVRTKGSAGSLYYSGFKESDNTVKRICVLSSPILS